MLKTERINKDFFKKYYPRRSKNSYKNLNGKVFIVAGSADMPGAAVLAARAAYRAGAGFVTIASVEQARVALINAVPEALVLDIKTPDGYLGEAALRRIRTYLKKNKQDVILIGCGLGAGAAITLKLLRFAGAPAVIDADSLNYIAKAGVNRLAGLGLDTVLTPHEGEIKRLLKDISFNKETAALTISDITGGVCLLKGPHTQVCFGGRKRINTSGNEGLAKAGSGDVLAGIIAALWAKVIRNGSFPLREGGFAAACMGVYLHGAAADCAVKDISKESLTASDVINALADTVKKLLK